MLHVISLLVVAIKPEEILYGYGPLGVGVVALSFLGYKMFNIILNDRDKAIAQRDVLLEDVFTKVLPAIAKNTEVLVARQELDREIIDLIKKFDNGLHNAEIILAEIKTLLSSRPPKAQTGGM